MGHGEFIKKIRQEKHLTQKDGYLLENLKAEEKQLFYSDRNRRHLHNQILVEAHLQYLQGKNLEMKQK